MIVKTSPAPLLAQYARKSERWGAEAKNTTYSESWEDGRLASQNNHLPGAWCHNSLWLIDGEVRKTARPFNSCKISPRMASHFLQSFHFMKWNISCYINKPRYHSYLTMYAYNNKPMGYIKSDTTGKDWTTITPKVARWVKVTEADPVWSQN